MSEAVGKFMGRALDLAANGEGFVSPNPCVGVVFVKDGKLISEGWHKEFGGPHAEVVAGNQLSAADIRGAEVYVSLEPCCHVGKTGACTEYLIGAGVERVFVGALDPNPLMNGKGVEALRAAGVEVEVLGGRFSERCEALNVEYFKWRRTGLPFVTLKAGVSMDGKIATRDGDSKWITDEEARHDARVERSKRDAVLVGAGTVLADDCSLLPLEAGSARRLLRVILDRNSELRGRDLKVFSDDNFLLVEEDLKIIDLLKLLGEKGVSRLFVEGGSVVHGAFVDASLVKPEVVDEVLFYYAPKLIGGKEGVGVVAGAGASKVSDALSLEIAESLVVGSCLKVRAKVIK